MNTVGGFNHAQWHQLLTESEKISKLSQGFHLLTCPWSALRTTNVLFLTLNPGVAPHDADLRRVSDERGNSYLVEETTTRSPITAQFIAMVQFLDIEVATILSGMLMPFRSKNWNSLSRVQREVGMTLGKRFWSEVLSWKLHRLIVTTGNETAAETVHMTNAELVHECPSGWKGIALRRYATPDGRQIVHLPHMSRFKLFSRKQCISPLRTIFDGTRGTA